MRQTSDRWGRPDRPRRPGRSSNWRRRRGAGTAIRAVTKYLDLRVRCRITTTPILLLRFPDGDVEYRSTRGELPVGTRIRTRGREWRIARYEGTGAFVEAVDEEPSGAPSGPASTPLGLGDDPLTLEILSAA